MKFGRTIVILLLTIILAIGAGIPAANAETTPYTLPTLQNFTRAVDDLEARGILSPTVAASQRDYYAEQASIIGGETISVDNLRRWNRFQALFRVQTYLTIGGVLLGLFGAAIFFGELILKILSLLSGFVLELLKRLISFLAKIPIFIYEILFCGVGILLMLSPYGLAGILFGAALFVISLLTLHGVREWSSVGRAAQHLNFISATCTIVYGILAVMTGSITLGVLASLAFVSFFGFRVLSGSLLLVLGFDDSNTLARGTIAAGFLTLFGVAIGTGYLPEPLSVFQTGSLFAGAFVYLLGLIILSSKWSATTGNYWPLQLSTIVSGLGLIYLGTYLEIGLLTGISGTLFAFYLLQKYTELCSLWVRSRLTFGLALLLASGAIFGVVRFLGINSEFFSLDFPLN